MYLVLSSCSTPVDIVCAFLRRVCPSLRLVFLLLNCLRRHMMPLFLKWYFRRQFLFFVFFVRTFFFFRIGPSVYRFGFGGNLELLFSSFWVFYRFVLFDRFLDFIFPCRRPRRPVPFRLPNYVGTMSLGCRSRTGNHRFLLPKLFAHPFSFSFFGASFLSA